MTLEPVTDNHSVARLATLAATISTTLTVYNNDFHLTKVDGRPAVAYTDKNSGAYIAITIEDEPVIWVAPAPAAKPPTAPAGDDDGVPSWEELAVKMSKALRGGVGRVK